MSNSFSSGKNAIAICDRCGWQFMLKELKSETRAGADVHNRVCSVCWDIDQPQLMLGRWPVEDPQAVRNPRPDTTYAQSRALTIDLNVLSSFLNDTPVPRLFCSCFVGAVTITIT